MFESPPPLHTHKLSRFTTQEPETQVLSPTGVHTGDLGRGLGPVRPVADIEHTIDPRPSALINGASTGLGES